MCVCVLAPGGALRHEEGFGDGPRPPTACGYLHHCFNATVHLPTYPISTALMVLLYNMRTKWRCRKLTLTAVGFLAIPATAIQERPPGYFINISIYNHARRLRLEKRLYLEVPTDFLNHF